MRLSLSLSRARLSSARGFSPSRPRARRRYGAFALPIPYPAALHGSTTTLELAAPGYHAANLSVALAAAVSAGGNAFGAARYAWVVRGDDAYADGACADLVAASWAPPAKCALAGVDLCALASASLAARASNASSFCECFGATRAAEPRGACSLAANASLCAGCAAGTSGPCQDQTTGACYGYARARAYP